MHAYIGTGAAPGPPPSATTGETDVNDVRVASRWWARAGTHLISLYLHVGHGISVVTPRDAIGKEVGRVCKEELRTADATMLCIEAPNDTLAEYGRRLEKPNITIWFSDRTTIAVDEIH